LGLALEETFERLFGSVRWVGFSLMATGVILALTRLTDGGEKGRTMPTWKHALIIGFVQGLAITPGISRSGSTIAAALFLGMERSHAARYSFLLSLPSIIGALVLKIGDSGDSVGTLALLVGFSSAAISGYFCLILLVGLIKKGRFSWFAPYCFAMGLFAVLLGS
jgi:undecaprenyl-diphosphatase